VIAVTPKPPSLPPASAEFVNILHLADPKATPQQTTSRMFRASDGKMRTDCGQTSIIQVPAQKQIITLNHLAKEARILPMPAPGAPPPLPATPGMPSPPKPPPPPSVNFKDLGKKMMAGHEVHGREYTVHPPHVQMPHFQLPPMPAPPKLDVPKVEPPKVQPPKVGAQVPKGPQASQLKPPDLPKLLHLPDAPKAPAAPLAQPTLPPPPHVPPPTPVVTEVWTSTQHSLPMLTKTTGSFGQQISQCKRLVPGEPPPSVFQIPPGYKIV
jgi:hypothetical protein